MRKRDLRNQINGFDTGLREGDDGLDLLQYANKHGALSIFRTEDAD